MRNPPRRTPCRLPLVIKTRTQRGTAMLLLAHLLAVAPHVAARCIDIGEHCQDWKYHGECKKNEGYMSAHCRKSCGFCDPVLVSMDKLMTDVDTNSDLFISLDELSARLLKIRLAEEKIGQLEAASARNEIARLQVNARPPHDHHVHSASQNESRTRFGPITPCHTRRTRTIPTERLSWKTSRGRTWMATGSST
jgi:hypothetical protein